jgi:hypothetical protein
MLSNSKSSRRTFFTKGGALLAGGLSVTDLPGATPSEDDALLLHEVKVLNEMADNAYKQLWVNLGGITEKELD